MTSDELLQEISRIDASLQALLEQRAKTVLALGDHLPGIESDIDGLREVLARNRGPWPNSALEQMFREIHSASRALTSKIRVAYLGPEGTYSQAAMHAHFGQAIEAVAEVSIPGIFAAVEQERVEFGVVPVENSTEGAVNHTLDMLMETPLRICGEVRLRIRHCLLGRAADLSTIVEVHAHPQALAQCRRWLDEHLPAAARVPSGSNAVAAALAAERPHMAAIAGESAAERYGLDVLGAGIEDVKTNTTRFLVMGRNDAAPTGNDATSLLLSASHRPGGLRAMLEPFESAGVSLTRIESRPSRNALWEYSFFIDVAGHQNDATLAPVLEQLRQELPFMRVLGSYPGSLKA